MTAQDALQRAMIAKRTRCQRCNGKGSYRAASGATVDCGVCLGSGKEPGR